MSASGYRRPKGNPAAIVAAIAVNIGIVAVIANAGGVFRQVPDDVMYVTNIPVTDPPPPLPEPTAKPEAKVPDSNPPPTIPDAQVPIEVPRPDIAATDAIPTVPDVLPTPGSGSGGAGTVTVDPVRPAPVLTDASPDPRARFQPDYPPSERRAGTEGTVTVRVHIGADGRVIAVERVSATSPAFFEATRRQALGRWRFRPATRDGVAVDSWRTMSLRFVLEDA